MNRRAWLLIFLFLAGVGILASLTWCGMDFMMKHHMAQPKLGQSETWDQKLNLSAEQRAKISPLEKTFTKDVNEIQSKIAMLHMENCKAMMPSGPLDRKVITKNMNDVCDLERHKNERTIDHFMALREILNPDQQKMLFTTLMQDICQECRLSTNGKNDYCGMCNLK